jgi:DNA-binding cell septation regulator SpoVG
MTINVKTIRQSRRDNVLAEAVLEIADGAESITIDNARVLRNRQGNLWLAMPSYSVPSGKGYEYLPVVTLSRELRRQAEDAALKAYEKWSKSHGGIQPRPGGEPAGVPNVHGIVATDDDVGF